MPRSPIRRASTSLHPFRAAAVTVLLALALPGAALALGNGNLQIHHVNVGQGDGMLLISPTGQTALFDDGNYLDCSGIKSYLQGLGITTVDYHFCSHYHSDHLGCIDDLAAVNITIGTAGYDRGYSYSSASYTAYVNTLGARRQTIARDQVITLDAGEANPVTITCVNLNGAGVYSVSGSDENAKSVVLRVTYGAFDEVIAGDLTGDGSTDVETTVGPQVGDVEVYKVHHHGSRYSTNDNWLNAITPEVGVIQVGDGNSYGHPTLDALTRLHNHGVKTYWNETGAGASPDPTWDTVANGAVVVEATPAAGGTYTVSGPGFSHSYTNGGGTPPVIITTTVVAASVTPLVGTITGGSAASLAADDAVRMTVTAAKPARKWLADWYGSATLAHPPTRLTLTYDGNFSISRTQTLYLWNWSSGAWTQVDQATVGTSDVTRTWTTTTPAAYVSPAGEARARVLGSENKSSYACRADYMAFTYDYLEGTGITVPVAEYRAWAAEDERDRLYLPQSTLLRLEAAPTGDGVALTWAVNKRDHVDGFNVYREDPTGALVHVGAEALLEVTSDEAVFRWTDAEPEAAGSVYWLGARSCSGPEALVGPLRVGPSEPALALALAATPNPARTSARLAFALPRAAQVRLDVFDLAGRRIATPFDGRAEAGRTETDWALTDAGGNRVSPGLYFARFEGLGRTLQTRIVVVGR